MGALTSKFSEQINVINSNVGPLPTQGMYVSITKAKKQGKQLLKK
jgi:hypothetical protein